jgi:hypothetical protein
LDVADQESKLEKVIRAKGAAEEKKEKALKD